MRKGVTMGDKKSKKDKKASDDGGAGGGGGGGGKPVDEVAHWNAIRAKLGLKPLRQ